MSTVLQRIDSGRVSYLTDLLGGIEEKWHSEFERFVETGEADDEFLNYLDGDKTAQHAVEIAFKRQAAKFEEWAGELQRRQATGGVSHDRTMPSPEPTISTVAEVVEDRTVASRVSTISTMIAEVVEDALQATSAERKEVVAKSTAALAESIPPEEAIVVKEVAQSLDRSIAQVAETNRS